MQKKYFFKKKKNLRLKIANSEGLHYERKVYS